MTFNRPGISDEFLMAAGVEFVTDPESHLRILIGKAARCPNRRGLSPVGARQRHHA